MDVEWNAYEWRLEGWDGMDRLKAHFHFGCLTFTNVGISRSQSIIRKSGNKGSDFPISEGRGPQHLFIAQVSIS